MTNSSFFFPINPDEPRSLFFDGSLRMNGDWLWPVLGFAPRLKRSRKALSSLLASAIHADAGGSKTGRLAVSSDKRFYQTNKGVVFSYDATKSALRTAVEHGLLRLWKETPGFPKGQCSTVQPTPRLLRHHTVAEAKIRKGQKQTVVVTDEHQLPVAVPPRKLKQQENRIADVIHMVDHVHLTHPLARTANGFSSLPTVRFRDGRICRWCEYQIGTRRIFRSNFSTHGRFYGISAQGLPARVRGELWLNKEPVVELDYSNLHPRLLLNSMGVLPIGDMYETLGALVPRSTAKVIFNGLINLGNRGRAQSAVACWIAKQQKESFLTARDHKLAHQVISLIKRDHPEIWSRAGSGEGLRLMYRDSEIALSVMKRLMAKGISSIPVHDSFIVQSRHQSDLEEAMDSLNETLRGVNQLHFNLPFQSKLRD